MMLNDSGQALLDPAPRRRAQPLRITVGVHPPRASRSPARVTPAAAARSRPLGESALALDIALDRMIDGILSRDRARSR